MLLSRFRCFNVFVPVFICWIGCHLFISSMCCAHKEDQGVKAHTISETKHAPKLRHIESLTCISRGGKVRVLLYKRGQEVSEKEIWNTFAKIDVPSNCVLVIIKWDEKSDISIEIGELGIEASGLHGIIALQLGPNRIEVKSSHNLLNDPRCFISINGIKCKDPSIKYYLA